MLSDRNHRALNKMGPTVGAVGPFLKKKRKKYETTKDVSKEEQKALQKIRRNPQEERRKPRNAWRDPTVSRPEPRFGKLNFGVL